MTARIDSPQRLRGPMNFHHEDEKLRRDRMIGIVTLVAVIAAFITLLIWGAMNGSADLGPMDNWYYMP